MGCYVTLGSLLALTEQFRREFDVQTAIWISSVPHLQTKQGQKSFTVGTQSLAGAKIVIVLAFLLKSVLELFLLLLYECQRGLN